MRIVAEIGSNHCGSLPLALSHIEAAGGAGCTGVKFQLFTPELLDSRRNVREEMARWALPAEWLPLLQNCAHRNLLEISCSPFDLGAVKRIANYVDALKISAYDLTYDELVGAAARTGLPLILSTAMATWAEIGHALSIVECSQPTAIESNRLASLLPRFGKRARTAITLLHGVAQYAARTQDMNMAVLPEMRVRFPRCGVGISDHTLTGTAAIMSVGLGGVMIEKHFKLSDAIVSPDSGHSITPLQMQKLVDAITEAGLAVGSKEKGGPLPCEMPLFETCRRSNVKTLRG